MGDIERKLLIGVNWTRFETCHIEKPLPVQRLKSNNSDEKKSEDCRPSAGCFHDICLLNKHRRQTSLIYTNMHTAVDTLHLAVWTLLHRILTTSYAITSLWAALKGPRRIVLHPLYQSKLFSKEGTHHSQEVKTNMNWKSRDIPDIVLFMPTWAANCPVFPPDWNKNFQLMQLACPTLQLWLAPFLLRHYLQGYVYLF